MKRYFIFILLLIFTQSIFATGNNNNKNNNSNNNNPVECPPASMIKTAKFSIATYLGVWFLYTRLDFKPNENWVLAFMTQLDLNNMKNQKEALRKGQEKFETLPISLTESGKKQNKSYCIYYTDKNNTGFRAQVMAINHMNNFPSSDFAKNLLK